jgi:glycolate oxidase FAD binding subunit
MSPDLAASLITVESRTSGVPRRDVEAYRVDGLTPSLALAPESVDQVRAVLAAAADTRAAVVPWGGGTQMGFGNLLEAFDMALDLRGMNEVVEYEPDDLTVAVQAGCTLAELNRRLGEHGEMLPVDAADPERATIGGLVASGFSGPRRLGYGSLRDLIIGITAVLPGGLVAKAGGMVVKNVTGFDMMRLYHGSLGSLAVIVQVNLKVLPRPRAERTIVAHYPALEPAFDAAMTVRRSQLLPTAITLLDAGAAERAGIGGSAWTLVLRCEAPPVAVVRQAARISDAISTQALALDVLEESGSEQIWTRINQVLAAEPIEREIRVRLGSAPSEIPVTLNAVTTVAGEHGLQVSLTVDCGSGLIYGRLAADSDEMEPLSPAWSALAGVGRHAALLAAPPAVKQGTDVFGPEPAGFTVMRSLKEQFDPNRVLNRGRFVGRL